MLFHCSRLFPLVLGHCFVVCVLVSFHVKQLSRWGRERERERERDGCFALIVLKLSVFCVFSSRCFGVVCSL